MTLLHSDGTGDATTTMCHRYTPPEQLPIMTKTADIVIVATGMYNSNLEISSISDLNVFGRCDSSDQGRHDQGRGSCY